MSIAAMQWVMEHSEARLPERFVLLLIANDADELGFDSHPSQRRMAFLSRDGQTQVRRWVDRLEGAGEVLVKRPDKPAPGRFTRYVLVMGRDPIKLAEEISWPTPRLDADVVAEWEQLALETNDQRVRHEAAGYASTVQSLPVAPYPSTVDAVENAGDETVDSGTTAPNGPRTAPSRAAIAGADPLTRVYNTDPRRPPPVDQVLAGFARPGEAYLSKDEVKDRIAAMRGMVPADGDEDATTLEEPAQPDVPAAPTPEDATEPDQGAPGPPSGSDDLIRDAWDERTDLT